MHVWRNCANPAEPIVTENQSLSEPTQGMRDAEDVECVLEKVNIHASVKWTELTKIFKKVNAQFSA